MIQTLTKYKGLVIMLYVKTVLLQRVITNNDYKVSKMDEYRKTLVDLK